MRQKSETEIRQALQARFATDIPVRPMVIPPATPENARAFVVRSSSLRPFSDASSRIS
jgi:hypothetical protein